MKSKCKTDGCKGEPLPTEIAEVLGEETEGLCEQCAGEVQSLERNRGDNSSSSYVESKADEREAQAFLGRSTLEDRAVLAGGLSKPRVIDDGLEDLRSLRDQHKLSEGRFLGERNLQVVDEALRLGRVSCLEIATRLDIHRTTVWRRVRRLRLLAKARKPLMDPRDWKRFSKMMRTYAGLPGGLDLESYNKATAISRAHRRDLPPSICSASRVGERILITGPGPLPPEMEEWVRSGEADYKSPTHTNCRACGNVIPRPSIGRPRNYCDERCRSRLRRQKV